MMECGTIEATKKWLFLGVCVFWAILVGHTETIQGVTNIILFHHSQNYMLSSLQTIRVGSIGRLQYEWV